MTYDGRTIKKISITLNIQEVTKSIEKIAD